jgi:NADPH:quinone reductase-like Zn-dependent oxidoreductase
MTELKTRIKVELEKFGWDIVEHELPIDHHRFKGTLLVLDDLSSSVLPAMRGDQWETLKSLTTVGNRILWVTEGSQLHVTMPENAMIHGLARTIRAEDPSISITTLDVEHGSGGKVSPTINTILKFLQKPAPKTQIDHEFVERRGILHISRVLPDHLVNKAVKEERHGAEFVKRPIHDADTTIRFICERLGTLDSLCYAEVDSKELSLGDNRVEVEIMASGLNFKDLAVTMAIVPENQHLLGLEGAGNIRRPGSTSYKVGQRVLVFEKGTFANRIIATTERVYPIPDSMSFEEAATLASVYLVSVYSLYDLANTQKGQRVLIHSATGGLGIACIQLCRHIGAEVYATAGNDEKRNFLIEKFGIPPSNIFNSRSTAFASELMRATNNEGVDVIINSLTGDLLEESWRCIREGGTMVKLGKKDMLDRNYLSMEPFGRNASYRCFDMAHKNVSDALIAR